MPLRLFLSKQWIPVIAWMLLIFIGSTDLLSSDNTSRLLVPLIRWFKPDANWRTIRRIQTIVRKGGHLAEYAILAILTWRALQNQFCGDAMRRNSRRIALIVLGIALLYASTDEFHQRFVSTRTSDILDVLIDVTGAAIGLSLVWCWNRRRANRQEKPSQLPMTRA